MTTERYYEKKFGGSAPEPGVRTSTIFPQRSHL